MHPCVCDDGNPRVCGNCATTHELEEHCPFMRAPILTERCIAVATRLSRQHPAELFDDTDLVARLVAVVNIESNAENGDGLDKRPGDTICETSEEERHIMSIASRDRDPVITKEILAKRWGIGLDTAHQTLLTTMQVGVRRVLHSVDRRYRTRQSHLRFPTLNTKFYTGDTMFSDTKIFMWPQVCASIYKRIGVRFVLSSQESE